MNFIHNIFMHCRQKWVGRLLDKNNSQTSMSNFFIFCLLIVGLLLLLVPLIILLVEVWFNHTVTTDLNGLAAYITSVVAIFTVAGITKMGVHYTDKKFIGHGIYDDPIVDEPGCDEPSCDEPSCDEPGDEGMIINE